MKEKTGKYNNIHKELIEKCKVNNREAQFEIYKIYYKSMYNTSLRIVNDPLQAEDLMQESFLSAFSKIDTFKGNVSFGAWLKRIVINKSIDYLRRKKIKFNILNDNHLDIKDEEPSDDFEKFSKKLQKLKNTKDIYTLIYRIAVVFFLFIITTGIFYMLNISGPGHLIKKISQISDELYEVEMYYKSRINNNYKKIRNLNFDNNKTEKKLVLSELKEMDAAYRDLQEDLTQNPYDDRVINAIINYYQLKLEFTDIILNQTKKTNI
jgi:RNA polymerase sigma factor (sigma-70 family)